MLKTILRFKSRVIRVQPGLSNLKIAETDWIALYNCYNDLQLKRLTSSFILTELSYIKKIDYADLVELISLKSMERFEKKSSDSHQLIHKKMSHPRHKASRNEPNHFIFESKDSFSHLNSPIAKTGVRILNDLQQASPESGYSILKKTPGGSKVHPVYSNSLGLTLYKPTTPFGTSETKGQVKPQFNPKVVKQLIPTAVLKRPETKTFQISINELMARQLSQRPISQTRLMRSSCKDFFNAHGCIVMKEEKNKYHWSHLIAYFLGGDQSRENLIAGTAASNYNTLQIVEHFIANKLISQEVHHFTLRAEPIFSDDSFIPTELIFTISWIKDEQHHAEEIRINPRSHQSISASMRESIALLRNPPEADDLQKEPDFNL